MSNAAIQNLLTELGLKGALEAYNSFVDEPAKMNETSMEVLLETILLSERDYRASRKQASLLRLAKLPLAVSETAIIYDEVRGRDFKERMARLLTMDFVEHGQNLTIFGAPGSGKSYVAAVLGRKNCMMGQSTLYCSTSELLNDFIIVYGSPTYKSRIHTIAGRKLLILDDFCLSAIDQTGQNILFDILNKRYDKCSTIIVSQKTPAMWLEVLGNTALAESIVERAASNNFTLTLGGTSRRVSLDPEPA